MSQPIPRRLLPHSASLEVYTGTVSSVDKYATTPIALKNVRFEQALSLENGGMGDTTNDKFTLFFSVGVSVGQVPKLKDRITFNGSVLKVRAVKPCFGSDAAVHHYEVALT